jgi:acetyl esterase/lipase
MRPSTLPSTVRRSAVAALLAAVALGSLSPALADPGKDKGKHKGQTKTRTHVDHKPADYAPFCVGDPADVQRLDITVEGQPAWGVYAMPDRTPKGIVVFAHGHGHSADSWRAHVAATAKRDGVIAIAMNYRHPAGQPDTYGWRVREGAADSIVAAQLFERTCPMAKTVVMYGVSMGGNTAGLAVAAKAKRHNGAPLFDYWFDIEGATNVTETYLEARGLALSGNATAKTAVAEIEEEFGGPIESRSDTYLANSIVTRAEDIKASGLKGVVMVHAVDDGLVGYNQSPEMNARLRQVGIPVDFWTAVTRGASSEPGTTLDGYVTGNVPGFESPFVGHADEDSDTHLVGATGFERLAALFAGVTPACRTGLLDGNLGFTQTSLLTSPATC